MELKEYSYGGTHKILLNELSKYPRNIKILDLGSGSGKLVNDMIKMGFENVWCCDGYMKPKLKDLRKFSKAKFDKKLPYKNNQFELIILSEVIEHLENPNFLLNEIHRILKKNGEVIINTPNIHTLIGKIVFFITGDFIGFSEDDAKFREFTGHIAPFSLRNTMRVFYNKFKIEKKFFGDFIIPFTSIHLPLRIELFGNTLFVKLKKI